MHIQWYSDDSRISMSDYENANWASVLLLTLFQKDTSVRFWKCTYDLLGYVPFYVQHVFSMCGHLVRHGIFICFDLSGHLLYLHHLTQADFSGVSKHFLVMGWHLGLPCKVYLSTLLNQEPEPFISMYIRLAISP